MRPVVYVETTILSYLAARPSRDVVVAAHQRLTAEWWHAAAGQFTLAASAAVTQEAEAGDPQVARPARPPRRPAAAAGSLAERRA